MHVIALPIAQKLIGFWSILKNTEINMEITVKYHATTDKKPRKHKNVGTWEQKEISLKLFSIATFLVSGLMM